MKETIILIIGILCIAVVLFFVIRAIVNTRKAIKLAKEQADKEKAERLAEIEKTKAEIEANDARIAEIEAQLKDYYDKQKQKYDKYSPLVKALEYDYSLIRDDGIKVHLFHFEDKFTYILWQNKDGFEVSVHDMKDKKGLYYAYQDTKDEFGKKFILEVIDALATFVAKIHLNGQAETNSLKEGTMSGYQSGYIAGYIRGQKDFVSNKWELPNKDERLNDLKNVPNKIGNMQK